MANTSKVTKRGITFYFKTDAVDPTLLHIYARHLASPADAIDAFFDYESEEFNIDYDRYETKGTTWTIYWFWLNLEKTKVMIVTCFRR